MRQIAVIRRCQCRNRKCTPAAKLQSQGQALGHLVLAPSPNTWVPSSSLAIITTPRLFMSSCRYSREITSVQRPMLHYLPLFLPHVFALQTCFCGYSIWSRGHPSSGTPRRKTLTPFCICPWPCEPVREWTSIQLHNRSQPSHRGGTPDTVIYDASVSQNAESAAGKKRKEA